MRIESVAVLLTSVGFVAALPSSAVKKNEPAKVLDEGARSNLEKSIESSITKELNSADEAGVDLLRAKKSPTTTTTTTTTFCVEIKPGTTETLVVACDPNKKDQQLPLPYDTPTPTTTTTTTTLFPKPNDGNGFGIPQTIPDYGTDFSPILPGRYPEYHHDPLIFIPNQPQNYPTTQFWPQIINPQPQIIFVRDPSCVSTKPTSVFNPLITNLIPSQNPLTLQSGASPKSANPIYPTANGEFLNSGFDPVGGGQLRSFSAISPAEGSFSNPLDLIYTRKGPSGISNQQQTHQQHQQQPHNQNQNPNPNQFLQPVSPQEPTTIDHQYERPLLIQCNPMVIPLSQEAYSAATGINGPGQNGPGQNGLGNNGLNIPGLGGLGSYGSSKPFFRSATGYGRPLVSGSQSIYMPSNQGGALYQRQDLGGQTAPGTFEQTQTANGATLPGQRSPQFSGTGGDASQAVQQSGFAKGGNAGGQSMSEQTLDMHARQQGKGLSTASGGFQSGNGGVAPGGSPMTPYYQDGGENGQGYQKQTEQQQQQTTQNGAPDHQTGENRQLQPRYSNPQATMRRMKSSLTSGDMVQPFMMPKSGMTVEKTSQKS